MIGWRGELLEDGSEAAVGARNALRLVAIYEPSYYHSSEGDYAAYKLAREQAAEALIRWRRYAPEAR